MSPFFIREITLREAINADDSNPLKTYNNLLIVSAAITPSTLEDMECNDFRDLAESYALINGDLDFEITGSDLTFTDGKKFSSKAIKKRDFDNLSELSAVEQTTFFISELLTPTEKLDTPVKYLSGINNFFRHCTKGFEPITRKQAIARQSSIPPKRTEL